MYCESFDGSATGISGAFGIGERVGLGGIQGWTVCPADRWVFAELADQIWVAIPVGSEGVGDAGAGHIF